MWKMQGFSTFTELQVFQSLSPREPLIAPKFFVNALAEYAASGRLRHKIQSHGTQRNALTFAESSSIP